MAIQPAAAAYAAYSGLRLEIPTLGVGMDIVGVPLGADGWGARYIYEVRELDLVRPNDPSVFRHKDQAWVTLVTCAGFDERTDMYRWRRLLRAVLVVIEPELDAAAGRGGL